MTKSADAFRTISEVADWLDTPAHVLRFWESKFTQVKPVKRAGGRRYYRPADMKLLGGIKQLLHDEGMTIKGVQKLLREQGMAHVAGLSRPLGDAADDEDVGGVLIEAEAQPVEPESEAEPNVETSYATESADTDVTDPVSEPPEVEAGIVSPAETAQPEPPSAEPDTSDTSSAEPTVLPSFRNRRLQEDVETQTEQTSDDISEEAAAQTPESATTTEAPSPSIEMPDLPEDAADDIPAEPGALTALARLPRQVKPELAAELQRIAAALRATGSAGGRQ